MPTFMFIKAFVHLLMNIYEATCTCVCKTSRIFILPVTKAWFKHVIHCCLFIKGIKNICLNCMEGIHDLNMTLTWQRERWREIKGRKRGNRAKQKAIAIKREAVRHVYSNQTQLINLPPPDRYCHHKHLENNRNVQQHYVEAIHLSLRPIYLRCHRHAAHQPSYRQRKWMGWRALPLKSSCLNGSLAGALKIAAAEMFQWFHGNPGASWIKALLYAAPFVLWDSPGPCAFSYTLYVAPLSFFLNLNAGYSLDKHGLLICSQL